MDTDNGSLSGSSNRINDFPLKVTDLAIYQMLEARAADEDIDNSSAIRVACQSGGCAGFKNTLDFDTEYEEDDLIKTFNYEGRSIDILIDEFSALYLEGVHLDYDIVFGIHFIHLVVCVLPHYSS